MPPDAHAAVRIRDATDDDVRRMTDVVNRAFAIETFLDGPRTDVRRMAAAMEDADFLIAEDDARRIVACVRVETDGPRGKIGMLAVDPECQGKGVGRAMVAAAEDRCRSLGCTEVGIAVLSLRDELLPFYRKLGYRQTGTAPFRPQRPLAGGVACHLIVLGRTL